MSETLRVRLFGGPELMTREGPVKLTPFQSAFLAVVFAEEKVSRPRVCRLMWGREIDGRARSSIRQLRHQVNRRAGGEVVGAAGDHLLAVSDVSSDIRDTRRQLADDCAPAAAPIIARRFAPGTYRGVSSAFLDWRDERDSAVRERATSACSDLWDRAIREGDWSRAVEAAQGLTLLGGPSPEGYARLIEAHARAGYVREAEAAYSEYRRTCARDESAEAMDSLMLRIRRMARESDATGGLDDIPFVGRQDSLARLIAVVETIGDAGCVFAAVTGEAGIGKTRLLHEVRRVATLDGIRCLTASPTSLERRISLSPIFDALSTIDLMPHLAAIGEPWRSVATSMMPARWDVGERKEPPPIDETALNRRLLESFALLLHSVAEEQPTLLFIDDLHWADTTTLSLLDFYRRRWTESSLGVLVAARSELVEPASAVAELLDGGVELAELVQLAELEESSGWDLVRNVGREDLEDEVISWLVAVAGRHPLYLIELTKELRDRRLSLEEAQTDSVPPSVGQIIGSRLGEGSDILLQTLRYLAVLDRSAGPRFLADAMDRRVDDTAIAIDDLTSRRLVKTEGGRARVAHAVFARAVYQGISRTLRGVMHRRVARLLERDGETEAGEIATHLDRGGEREAASRLGWAAAKRYLGQGATAEASHFFRLVSRNEDDPRLRALALAKEAEAAFLARDLVAAASAAGEAAKGLREEDLRAEARRCEVRRVACHRYLRSRSMAELIERIEEVKIEARQFGDWEALALALESQLQVLFAFDGSDLVPGVFDELRSLSEVSSPPVATASRLSLALGCVVGDPGEGLRAARQAVTFSEEAPTYRPVALLRLLVALHVRGRFMTEEGQRTATEALTLATKIGDVRTVHIVEANHAVGYLDAAEHDRAANWFARAAQSARRLPRGVDTMNAAYNQGELKLALGDFDAARRLFEMAAEDLKLGAPLMSHALVNSGVGLCALETGDLKEARRREELVPNNLPPWCHDPSIIVAFKAKLASRRGRRDVVEEVLAAATSTLEGRLELAWLKVGLIWLDYLRRWGRHDELVDRAEPYIRCAERYNLERVAAQFEQLTVNG